MTTPVEYAAGDDPGPNPLRMRSLFPQHWGDVPDGSDALGRWIEHNALQDGARSGHPASVRTLLERRRQDPEAVREQARTDAACRMRREFLMRRLTERP